VLFSVIFNPVNTDDVQAQVSL